MRQQAEADENIMAVETLAKMGFDLATIVNEVERLGLPYNTAYIQRMIFKYQTGDAQEPQGFEGQYNTEVQDSLALLSFSPAQRELL
jgi:hypothetical protein